MEDWDAEIDGFPLTVDQGVFLEELELGEVSQSDQDAANPVGNGRFFGRDFSEGYKFKLNISVLADDARAARDKLAAFAKVWNKHYEPGDESVFRYRLGGDTMRVFGRCRKFAPAIKPYLVGGGIKFEAEFATSDPYFYTDEKRTRDTKLTPSSYSDLEFPVTFPITFATTGTRDGIIEDTDGNAPAPFEATFYGPFQNVRLAGKGWVIDLDSELKSDRHVTVDTRKMTVLRDDGVSLAGDLRRSTFLQDCRLKPGVKDEFKFDATDSSNRARAEISWRPTWTSF